MSIDLSGLRPEQREIATTLEGPLFVSAGAGSGKTFTLTQRILWALSPESGPFVQSLDQILAITFTKDAAAEIRERVRAALLAAGMDEAARSVDGAWISTIHGMCSRILRAHALERGIDPEFTVLEDPSELIERAFSRVLAAAGAREGAGGARAAAPRFAPALAWYPIRGELDPEGRESGASIHRIVLRLIELAGTLPGGMGDVRLERGYVDMAGFADACRSFMKDFPAGKGAQQAASTLEAIEAFEAGPRRPRDVVDLMLACQLPAARGKAKQAALLLKAEAAEALVNAYIALSAPALDALLDLAAAVEDEFGALKREAGVLDNNDLLLQAWRALSEDESIRARYAGRFKMVMIDEFQDTDQLQVDLIGLITGPGARSLCTVGDAQQSIYRFRGADVEVFRAQERSCRARSAGEGGGRLVKLARNFRSHAQILGYVAQVFDDARGGIMPGFLDLEAHEARADGLVAQGASRRQAVLAVGGSGEERLQASARAIAGRFRALADAGQPVGGMVLLLGRMTHADAYAAALRAAGLDCVIAGGSVFASAPEVRAVRALACALANPADTAQGLAPLLASPFFALGAEEFLALATDYDAQTGETRRRNLDRGILPGAPDAPGLEGLPLTIRAREVMGRALARVGRDAFSAIVRDVVDESGWLVRLERRGAEGRAVAANILKAIDAIEDAEAREGNRPRAIALAFDRFLQGKQAPGALMGADGDAVRIMTVHASKGLEFPVVAVAECFGITSSSERFQVARTAEGARAVAMPALFPAGRGSLGERVAPDKVADAFGQLCKKWLPDDLLDDVCARGSAAEAFARMRADDDARSLEERARLLYVAMTRAREVLILCMESRLTTRSKVVTLAFDDAKTLTGRVLERILPAWPSLDGDRLAFEGSKPGDFELIALRDFQFEGAPYAATVAEGAGEEAPGDPVPAPSAADGAPDTFTLVYPEPVALRTALAAPEPRDSYSYTSLARALHADAGDRAPARSAAGEDAGALPGDGEASEPAVGAGAVACAGGMGAACSTLDTGAVSAGTQAGADGDPTALGSAFHAAAQWMVEAGSDLVPPERIDALRRYWGVTPAQRERLERALERWRGSEVRAEALSWPCVRAEVPFFSRGMEEVREAFGPFAEGAIDLLCTGGTDAGEALVIDYKTGGSAAETPEELRRKHELQARVYADVLHKAGYERVRLRFVRVEIDDPDAPGQPQTVSYEYERYNVPTKNEVQGSLDSHGTYQDA